MIVHQVDEKTYFKSWSFPSSSKTSLCSVNYNYWMVLVSILITDIREYRNIYVLSFRLHVMSDPHMHVHVKVS